MKIIISNFLKQTFDKKSKYFSFLGLPVIIFVLMFTLYGSPSMAYKISIGVVDSSNNELSKKIVETMDRGIYTPINISYEESIDNTIAYDTIIYIPQEFNTEKKVEMVIVKNPGLAIGLEGHINRVISDYKSGSPVVTIKSTEVNSNKSVRYAGERALGFLLIFMFAQGLSVTSLIIKSRENRTYDRLKTTPLKRSNYLMGNLIAAFLILMVQVIVGLLVISNYYSFNLKPMFILLGAYALVVVSLGLLITSIATTRELAGNLSTILLTPMAMLGGCFWSVELMPDFMQKISMFTPQYWTMTGLEHISSGGNSIGLNLTVLLSFSTLFALFAIYRFKEN